MIINMLGWNNVRGLNDQDRRDTVHERIASSSCHIACLQKLSLDDIVSEEEVKAAINQIPSDKALGPDGFTVLSSRDVGAQ
jgi:hypothetical protein